MFLGFAHVFIDRLPSERAGIFSSLLAAGKFDSQVVLPCLLPHKKIAPGRESDNPEMKVVDSKRMTPAIRRNADESESE
ncbi:MAG: hypothetical protein CMO80_23395, partial [Verrucomicrobiales bacterium]|nr:hypothetical protein [Verrucomicrobiales bacterium]